MVEISDRMGSDGIIERSHSGKNLNKYKNELGSYPWEKNTNKNI